MGVIGVGCSGGVVGVIGEGCSGWVVGIIGVVGAGEFGIENDKKNINSIELLNNLIYNAKKGDKESLLNTLEKLINKGINLNYRDENDIKNEKISRKKE